MLHQTQDSKLQLQQHRKQMRDQKRREARRETGIRCAIGIALLVSVLCFYAALNVMIYYVSPSWRYLESGYGEDPVVCETISFTDDFFNCDWYTCNEWCLSASLDCAQVFARVRLKGKDLTATGCNWIQKHECYPREFKDLQLYKCKEVECSHLNGTLWCNEGVCVDVTSICEISPTKLAAKTLDCSSRVPCKDMAGFYQCQPGGHCKMILSADGLKISPQSPFPHSITPQQPTFNLTSAAEDNLVEVGLVCEPQCKEISANQAPNLVVIERGFNAHMARYNQLAVEGVEVKGLWQLDMVPVISCSDIIRNKDMLELLDCFSPKYLKPTTLTKGQLSMQKLLAAYNNAELAESDKSTEMAKLLMSMEEIVIYNRSKLKATLDSCVNSLRGECSEIFAKVKHDGRDGSNIPSVYPCYYSKTSNDSVIFKKYGQESLTWACAISISLSGLMLASCIGLYVATKIVTVTDHGKMVLDDGKFKYCHSNQRLSRLEDHHGRNKVSPPPTQLAVFGNP